MVWFPPKHAHAKSPCKVRSRVLSARCQQRRGRRKHLPPPRPPNCARSNHLLSQHPDLLQRLLITSDKGQQTTIRKLSVNCHTIYVHYYYSWVRLRDDPRIRVVLVIFGICLPLGGVLNTLPLFASISSVKNI